MFRCHFLSNNFDIHLNYRNNYHKNVFLYFLAKWLVEDHYPSCNTVEHIHLLLGRTLYYLYFEQKDLYTRLAGLLE